MVSFKLIPFYMHLTLVHGAWIWGEPPPSEQSSEDEYQPNRVGGIEGTHEPVSQSTATDHHLFQGDDPHTTASIWREHTDVILEIHAHILDVYSLEHKLSDFLGEIIEDLEDAEVQEII